MLIWQPVLKAIVISRDVFEYEPPPHPPWILKHNYCSDLMKKNAASDNMTSHHAIL